MPDISFSTMWMRGRFARPRDFFLAGVEMGFCSFELSGVAGVQFYDEVHPGDFDIRSLHDPAPADMQSGDLARNDIVFTSLDEEKRKQAVAISKGSVDIADRYGARAVILHVGRSDADPHLQDQLESLYREGKTDSPAAGKLRSRLAGERMVHYEQHMDALMRSLDDLVPYAAARGVRLGVENRRHIHEVPNFDEVQRVLAHYSDDTIGYWHDVGHAETLAVVGMTAHADWLCAFGHRIVGVHLHDVIGLTDHRAPGTGSIDWQGLAALLPGNGLRTAEIHPEIPAASVSTGVAHLAATGWIRP